MSRKPKKMLRNKVKEFSHRNGFKSLGELKEFVNLIILEESSPKVGLKCKDITKPAPEIESLVVEFYDD